MQGRNKLPAGRLSRTPTAPGLTLELCEELMDSTVSWSVPQTQLSTDRLRVLWFVDGRSKINGQGFCWKATGLIEEGKKREAWYVELHVVFQAVMEELTHVKKSLCLGFCFFFFLNIYLFGCARSSLWHVRSSSLTRDWTQVPCTGNTES